MMIRDPVMENEIHICGMALAMKTWSVPMKETVVVI